MLGSIWSNIGFTRTVDDLQRKTIIFTTTIGGISLT
jgi:hypothetical protein